MTTANKTVYNCKSAGDCVGNPTAEPVSLVTDAISNDLTSPSTSSLIMVFGGCFFGPFIVLIRLSIRHEISLQHFVKNDRALKKTAMVSSYAHLICLPKAQVVPV